MMIMRCGLLLCLSEVMDQSCCCLAICLDQFRAAILQWAAAAAQTLDHLSLVHLWKFEISSAPPIKFISIIRLCLMSRDCSAVFSVCPGPGLFPDSNPQSSFLHTLVIKAKPKIIIISKLTEPICLVQRPRPPELQEVS